VTLIKSILIPFAFIYTLSTTLILQSDSTISSRSSSSSSSNHHHHRNPTQLVSKINLIASGFQLSQLIYQRNNNKVKSFSYHQHLLSFSSCFVSSKARTVPIQKERGEKEGSVSVSFSVFNMSTNQEQEEQENLENTKSMGLSSNDNDKIVNKSDNGTDDDDHDSISITGSVSEEVEEFVDEEDDDGNDDDLSMDDDKKNDNDKNTNEIQTHYIFLVHGWLGNSLEMSYIENAIVNQVQKSATTSAAAQKSRVIVHSVTANNGRTTDGIAKGGIRIAQEIQNFMKEDVKAYTKLSSSSLSLSSSPSPMAHQASISFVGNSLGGLYSRYALSCIPTQLDIPSMKIVLHYNIFCTTVTPHLGVASNTYIKLPRFMEHVIGNVLLSTGRDLFRVDSSGTTSSSINNENKSKKQQQHEQEQEQPQNYHTVDDLIYTMAVDEIFITPLMSFSKRLAYINAFGTDFQVPTSTAAFLDSESTYPHYVIEATSFSNTSTTGSGDGDDDDGEKSSFIATKVITKRSLDIIYANQEWYSDKSPHLIMSNKLDALGWDKVFIDTRDKIPLPTYAIPKFFKSTKKSHKEEWDDFVKSKSMSMSSRSSTSSISGGNSSLNEDDDKDKECDSVVGRGQITAIVESKDMHRLLTSNDRVQIPAGHSVLVANSKSKSYAKFTTEGKPVMDRLASDIIGDIFTLRAN